MPEDAKGPSEVQQEVANQLTRLCFVHSLTVLYSRNIPVLLQ
jgi:hypothetical protein